MSSYSTPVMFAATAATIWLSAGVCKLYYTKRAADLIAAKGWPSEAAAAPPPVAPPSLQGIARVQVESLDEANPGESRALAILSGSKSICYAPMGTFLAAVGFWLLTPTSQ